MSATSFQIELPDTVLAGARRGDLRALETIYRAFERPAYTLALRMLGDAEHARETVHDAMLRLFERVAQFRGDAPFWGWLRQIVVNEALMRIRRERGLSTMTRRSFFSLRMTLLAKKVGSIMRKFNLI